MPVDVVSSVVAGVAEGAAKALISKALEHTVRVEEVRYYCSFDQ